MSGEIQYMTFQDFGLRPELLNAIQSMGFEQPTPVQQEAIPFILNNQQDVVSLAQTGTGKTAAFGLPLLHQIDTKQQQVQALILCPTRELCLQITKELNKYAQHCHGIRVVAVYGGASVSQQKKQLRKGAHIVVGTPGRTLDLQKQGALKLQQIQRLILDEADEMLNMGFQKDLEKILSKTPREKQSLLFSATLPSSMNRIVNNFMNHPHRIQVAKTNIGSSHVTHYYCVTKKKHRYDALQRLVDATPDMYGIVFCRTRRETQQVADKLMQAGYNADTIHGDLSQNLRDSVMKKFKEKTVQLLVATDVAARGIDVDELTHVINYQLPDDEEMYVHRSGRTGRAGNDGVSICITTPRDRHRINRLEKMIGQPFEQMAIPTKGAIKQEQLTHFLKELSNFSPDKNMVKEYWPMIEEHIGDLASDEIINRLLAMQMERFQDSQKGKDDLNEHLKQSKNRGGKAKSRPSSNKMEAFTLQAGRADSMNPKRLLALINEQTDSKDIYVGDISVHKKRTVFEVDAAEAQRVEHAFAGLEYEGKDALVRGGKVSQRRRRKGRRNRSKQRG